VSSDPAPIRGRWTTPEGIARAFHEAYESLAEGFGYQTRRASAVPWEDVPEANKALMIATIRNVFIEQGLALRPPAPDEAAIERGAKALREACGATSTLRTYRKLALIVLRAALGDQ
jgi:hypothetical protein